MAFVGALSLSRFPASALSVCRTSGQRSWPKLRRSVTRTKATTEAVDSVAAETSPQPLVTMDELVSLCKRRGFIFPSSDIYNGFNGFYDFGPLGVELKQNIKQQWWRTFVHGREDMTGLDSSIIASPSIWEASGHVDGFSDPMVDCKGSKLRYRADQLLFARVSIEGQDEPLGYLCMQEPAGDLQHIHS